MSNKNRNNRQPTPAERAPTGALSRWKELDQKRNGFLRRVENYAAVTIPKVCLPDGVDQSTESIQHDWQSVGAQAVNHLLNKLMLAMFSPSQPFFRIDADADLAKKLAAQGIDDAALRAALVGGEQRAIKVLDQKGIRPKLYEALKHLIITGNVLLDRSRADAIRIMGIKRFVVKRSVSGKVIEVMIHERVLFDELEDDVQRAVGAKAHDTEVDFIRWYKWANKVWTLTQHVDQHDLGAEFTQDWKDEDKFPIHPLVWDLADEHDYGTGLVEDYAGDFGTLSTLSEAEVKAAILSSDYRWLANPAGITDIAQFKNSQTGDVLAGKKDDLTLVSLVNGGALEQLGKAADKYIRRIGMAFLLGTAVTRDAERVTAEEIRMQATELETALGGVYSRLAVDLQLPLVRWLLGQTKIDISGTSLVPTITTGLAALSRAADAQALVTFLQDLAGVAQMPPDVLARLQLSAVLATLAAARGIDSAKYVKPEEQVQQELKAQQDAQQNAVAQQEVAKAGAQALAQPPAPAQ
jgi:hypothetical protein